MKKIKAIKTKYKHNLFRSRLEAKWAKYFDLLGIEYEYEPEGFVLSNGQTYLPDFKIMSNVYIEVKPIFPDKTYIENKLKEFVDNENTVLILLVGEPQPADYIMYFKNGSTKSVEEMYCFINTYTVQKWGTSGIFYGEYYFGDDEIYYADLEICRKANNINGF